MIWNDEYPPGFLAIVAGILVAMTLNAGVLTIRDVSGVDLHSHPVTACALVMALVGAGFAVAALHPHWRMTCLRGLGVAALAAATLAAVAPGDVVPRAGVPWILHLGFVGMIAAAVCLRSGWFAGYCLLMLVSQWRLATPSLASASLLAVVAIGVTTLAFVKWEILLLTSATQRATRRAEAAAIERTRATAAQAAREQWNSWVHDNLLVAFRLGSQRSPAARDLAAELVATGLSRPEATFSDLHRSARDVAAGQGVRLRWDVISDGEAPVAVGQAIDAAIGEAIRNSARHSGATMVSVSGELTSAGCHVTVTDAGSGFEPAAVGANQFGIRSSIYSQMEAVGGWAEVLSEPGAGTQVRLGWQVEEEPAPTLEVPLGWVVVAASGITVLAAARAGVSLGAEHGGWVLAGLLLVILLTAAVSAWPRVTPVALSAWLVAASLLALTAPAAGDRESENWLAVGSAVFFIAVARVRRERLGLAFAAATFVANVVLGAALRPQDLGAGLAYWAQPVIYAGLAWLGISQFERLLRRYRDASQRAITLQEAVITARAERDESQRWLAGMPAEVLPLLEDLAGAGHVDADLGHRCALAEAATRDYLTAPRLVNPELEAVVRSIREGGTYVSLTDGGPRTPPHELHAVRSALRGLAGLTRPASRLTVRWTLSDPECFATLTITCPEPDVSHCLDELAGVAVFSDADALHLRFHAQPGGDG